jgi:hypothetical protein
MWKYKILLSIILLFSFFSINTYAAEEDIDIMWLLWVEEEWLGTEDNKINSDWSIDNWEASFSKDWVKNTDWQSVNENNITNWDQKLNEWAKVTPTPLTAKKSSSSDNTSFNSASENWWDIKITKLPQTWPAEVVLLLILSLILTWLFMYVKSWKKI